MKKRNLNTKIGIILGLIIGIIVMLLTSCKETKQGTISTNKILLMADTLNARVLVIEGDSLTKRITITNNITIYLE